MNPAVSAHGGEIVLVEVKGSEIFIEMGGGCQGCSSAGFTLSAGIEQAICHEIDEIEHVVDVTDHQSGEEPFYSE